MANVFGNAFKAGFGATLGCGAAVCVCDFVSKMSKEIAEKAEERKNRKEKEETK